MRIRVLILSLLLLSFASVATAAEKTWKVRYNAGPLNTKSDPKNWDNNLTVEPDSVTLRLRDGQKLEVKSRSVTGLSYGQEAYRRLTTVFVVYGLFHKSREHFIGIEYDNDGKKTGLLLQGDKDDYRDILGALKRATGASIAVSDKDDRRFVADLVQSASEQANQDSKKEELKEGSDGQLHVSVRPHGSDVYVDNDFAGKTPCVVPIPAGKHKVTVVSRGFLDWTREFKVSRGEQVSVDSSLQKAP